MKKTPYIWMNGKFVKWNDAKIHVLSHALHYGSGAFEGIRFYKTKKGPVIFRLKEHVDRLFYSAETIFIKIPYSKKTISEAIIKIVKKNKVQQGYIRPVVFHGYGKMGISPIGSKPMIAIAALPWGTYLSEDPIRITISKYIRIHPRSCIPDAKICGYYVNAIMAHEEASKAGADEALMLDYKGNIAEGSSANFYMVKNGSIYTPPLGMILNGITRDTIKKLAKDLRIPFKEQDIKPGELKKADECFFTGTAAEVTPIGIIDKKKIRDGKIGEITSLIKNTYHKAVTGKLSQYKSWLTYVS